MISIVVYGRNDSHGYNMHKRIALSLNCMAAVLTEPLDEILFVDFNTPDDFPTFPEAIRDTLTPETKKRLRVLRVRPWVHAGYRSRTRLAVVEPLARNVAVRRSNPANRWILSTNTDMIFIPREGDSLTEVARDLPPGHYGIPRFELPETLWESLDRDKPSAVIPTVAEWGSKFHLNEIVYGNDAIKFDSPGDFQLVQRFDLFKIHGFNEQMLHGWHVDSNLFSRLNRLHGGVSDLSRGVYGYHCGHTRMMTLSHAPMRAEDDFSDFVHKVREPELPRQAQTWGLPHEEIEEIRLDGAAAGLLPILAKLAGPPLEKPTEAFYVTRTYDKASYDPVHVLPFVADLFVNTQKKGSVAWVGRHARMFNLFREFRLGMGFKGPIMVCQEDADSLGASAMGGVEVTSPAGMCSRADAFVFDYVSPDGGPIPDEGEAAETGWVAHLTRTFLLVVETERARMRRGAPQRRVIAINAIHSRFEKMVTFNVNAGIAPYGTRLRYGLVKEFNPGPYQWLALGTTGAAGLRKGDRIETVPGVEGHVVYGPYFPLAPGKYHAVFGLDVEERAPLAGEQVERGKRAVYLDVVSAHETRFGAGEIIDGELKSGEYCVAFEIGEEDETQLRASAMEARVWTNGKYQFAVTSVRVERLDEERRPGKEESKSNAGGK